MKNKLITIASAVLLIGCAHSGKQDGRVSLLPVSEVKWEKLNPARGDKSPLAGTLWGDRKGKQPTGFLAKFADGFSSPPHIHNVSYKAIVIDGLIHNDDSKAKNMWMPQSSYWTQPAGEAHITSAKGESNIALVEIDSGPYLVRPVKQSFDNGERPYNIHSSNIIWRKDDNHEIADLWKDQEGVVTGSLLRFSKSLRLNMADSKLVVITGQVTTQGTTLSPGSLISVDKNSTLNLSCELKGCIVYLKYKTNIASRR